MFNVDQKSLLKAVIQSVRGGETARGTTGSQKEQRAVKVKAKGPGKSCRPRGRRGRCGKRSCPLTFCLRQPDVEPDGCGLDEVAPHGKVSLGDCDEGQDMSGRLQPGERLSDCQDSSCPAPPPSPIHRSRQQRLPVVPGGPITRPEEQSSTPELPPDKGGSWEEDSDVSATGKESGRPSLRTKLRGFFKSLGNRRGQVRSQQSKASDYVVDECTERDLSDSVSMESITIATEISHRRPEPTIETRKVAWKASKRKSKSSKEWDRWQAVESSYAGRYSSKVAPLPCPLDDDDCAEQRPILYRSNIKTSTRVSAFDIEGALADPRVRQINSASSGPSSSGCQPNGNARASSSRTLYRNQVPSAAHPTMAASWAITDWTTTRRGEGPETQKPPQQEQEGTVDQNVLAFMSYHKYRSLSNMAVSSAMSVNPSSHSADDVDGGRRNTNSAGQRKTHRIIHVKPLSPKPTGYS